jgi:hypothetical protein
MTPKSDLVKKPVILLRMVNKVKSKLMVNFNGEWLINNYE